MSEKIDSYNLCESTQRRLRLVSSGIASLIGNYTDHEHDELVDKFADYVKELNEAERKIGTLSSHLLDLRRENTVLKDKLKELQ